MFFMQIKSFAASKRSTHTHTTQLGFVSVIKNNSMTDLATKRAERTTKKIKIETTTSIQKEEKAKKKEKHTRDVRL